ncbi:MAG: helix-turn-helix domain-containing protein [Pseudomonadota bacterium]|nr:MAG: TetR/AcrR family transcriptional regulator [Pseudomonadota bacterium]
MVETHSAAVPARERILEAAERVVTDVGPARLTLDLVAQAAGVSKGGLLYHFPSKESLLVGLSARYVERRRAAIEAAKADICGQDAARDVKACIVGMLLDGSSTKEMGAALLAAAANDFALLESIRQCTAQHTEQLASAGGNFARAAIACLAVEGLKMRECLRVSSFTEEQRAQIVEELLKIAAEAYR